MRIIKIVLSAVMLLISITVATSNPTSLYTTIAIIIAIISTYILLKTLTHNFHSGYLQDLSSGNDSTKECIVDLFKVAKKSIKIVSGVFALQIYFSPEVFVELRAAKERGVKIAIIFANHSVNLETIRPAKGEYKTNFETMKKWIDDGSIVVKRINKEKIAHFIVIDNLHLCIEKKHGHKKDRQQRYVRVEYLEPVLARKYALLFKAIDQKALAL